MATPAPVSGFNLSCELRGHQQDVRGVNFCPLGVLTGSRDRTVKLWTGDAAQHSLTESQTFVGHTDYVGPVLYIQPNFSPEYPAGALVSGSLDKTVIVWDIATSEPIAKLEGHTYQVTAIGVLPSGEIVSASVDKTIKVWRDGKCAQTLLGHEGPVLSLIVLPDTGEIVSGSGDTTIKVWSNGKCTKTLTGHTDTVRGLACVPNIGFVSGSHDLSARVWTASGDVIAELLGHTAIIFCVAATQNGIIASGSDDNTVRLWQASGQCLQVLEHPSCVWDLKFSLDCDLISGCGDAVARIWSDKADRKASDETIAAYQALLAEMKAAAAAAKAQSEGGGGGSETQLPPGVKCEEASALMQVGTKDGQTKVIKEANGAINAYAWDSTGFQWEKIGEVVAAPAGGSAKKFYQGQEWDFVFDVDVAEGAPLKKLPYNRSENPYIAADRFLEAEELPIGFKEQVVQFIIQNAGLDKPTALPNDMPITGGFCDPFTGGSSSSATGSQRPAMAPPPPLDSLPVTGGGIDPISGGAGPMLTHVPATVFMAFDNVPPSEALGRKLREFSAQLGGSSEMLSEAEAAGQLDKLLQSLAACAAAPIASSSNNLDGPSMALAIKLLNWPPAQLFPALDVARCVALDPLGASTLVSTPGQADLSGSMVQSGVLAATLSNACCPEPSVPANQQLAVRLLCNLFKQASGRAWVAAHRAPVLDAFAHCCHSPIKAVRVSMATLLYNYSIMFSAALGDEASEAKMQVVSALSELLNVVPLDDNDSAFRAMIAVGTLCHKDATMCSLAKDLGVQDFLQRLNESPEAKSPTGRRLLEAAIDLSSLFRAAP